MPVVHGVKERRIVETPNGVEVDGKVVPTSQLARVFGADPELMAAAALARAIVSNPLAVGEPYPPFRRVDALSPREADLDLWRHPPDGVLVRYAGTTSTNRGLRRTLLSWLGLR